MVTPIVRVGPFATGVKMQSRGQAGFLALVKRSRGLSGSVNGQDIPSTLPQKLVFVQGRDVFVGLHKSSAKYIAMLYYVYYLCCYRGYANDVTSDVYFRTRHFGWQKELLCAVGCVNLRVLRARQQERIASETPGVRAARLQHLRARQQEPDCL